jgi:hypothetical protein
MPGVKVSKLSLTTNEEGQVAGPAGLLHARRVALLEQTKLRRARCVAVAAQGGTETTAGAHNEHGDGIAQASSAVHSEAEHRVASSLEMTES